MATDEMIDLESKREKQRVYQLAWYHRTKHKRGIKSAIRKTPEELRLKQREGERRRYREARAKLGKIVRATKIIHHTPEEKRAANLKSCAGYRARHLDRKRKSARDWNRRNMRRLIDKTNHRYHTDPKFNLKTKLRRRIYTAIYSASRGVRKADTTIKLLGCSFDFFKGFIEGRFSKGMTWEHVLNGQIHLDHILPISAFDLRDPIQQNQAFNYSNVQPLWAQDNLSKSAKRPPTHQAELI